MTQTDKRPAAQRIRFPIPGTIAGFVATIPMTLVLLIIHRLLPGWQRYALPPEEVTKELAERSDIRKHLDKPGLVGSSVITHFGYGAAMGAIYSTLTRQIALPPVLKGTLFGLVIWATSYLGWMPLANISVAAPEEPIRRNMMMIIAHIVWGSVTGLISDRLERSMHS
jgi:putative membrane protein